MRVARPLEGTSIARAHQGAMAAPRGRPQSTAAWVVPLAAAEVVAVVLAASATLVWHLPAATVARATPVRRDYLQEAAPAAGLIARAFQLLEPLAGW